MKISSSGICGAVGGVVMVAGIIVWCAATPSAGGQTVRAIGPQSQVQIFGGSSIGVSVTDLDAATATKQKLTASSGAVVTQVRADGPAAKAGMKVDDVIVTFDGESVRSARQFSRLVDETPNGREVAMTVVRDAARVNLKVTPDAADSFSSAFAGNSPLRDLFQFNSPNWTVLPQPFFGDRMNVLSDGNNRRLGVEVQELTGQLGDYFGTKDGVLVTSVDDGTPAKTAGMKAGDVITKINGRPVLGLDDLRRRITGASGDVTVTFYRDRKEMALTVKLDGGTNQIIK
jgi:serine protease Do